MECETNESQAEDPRQFNLYSRLMCKQSAEKHQIFLNLYRIAISENLVLEAVIVKVSQNLNSMQKISKQ